ncbi:MAG: hypothetical protein ACKV2V_29065 [Blastocatellia bacterium]
MTVSTNTTLDRNHLDMLCAEIELAWADQHDPTVADRLAAQHPQYARSLYDFLAILLGSELAFVKPAANVRSLLEYLTQHTGEKPTVIAARMDVPYPFLLQAQRHPQVIPFRAKEEIVTRAVRAWKVDAQQARHALDNPRLDAIAASRDNPYSADAPDYEAIVKRAKMKKKEQEFWMSMK